MKNIIIFGSGGHAKVIIDIVEKQRIFEIRGLIDDAKAKGDDFFRYEILGSMDDLLSLSKRVFGGIVAIGDNWTRSEVVSYIKGTVPDFNFVTAIHPSASIARGASIDNGTVVMAGVVINSDSTIGSHCIINTKASIDHDNSIGDFVTVAPAATTGGTVKIGNYAVLSLGSNIIQAKSVGEHSVIGAGSTVLDDIPSYTLAYGSPAKVIRKREAGEKYL